MLALFMVSGCAGTATNECGVFRPIYTSSGDMLTEGTERQIVAHNLTGEALCGWMPPG